MLRILHVLTAMDRAGAETMLMNLYRAIDKDKIQFDFAVTAKDHCDYDDEILNMGGKIIHYPKYNGKNHFAYKKWWNEFFRSHPEYKIVHGHIGSTASIYLKIAKKHGCYTIAHSHSAGMGFGMHNILYRLYSHSTRYIADYFIGCSTEALIARYGRKVASDKARSIVLNNGIDTSKYAYSESIRKEMLSSLGLSESSFVIGTVGRLTEPKNPMFILDILSELKKSSDFVFLWAGAGELRNDIETKIKELGLSDNVRLLGVRDDIPRLLQTLNVFILPSKFEGLPVIGVEVQAAGVPMLCSDKVSPEVKMSEYCKFLGIDSVSYWVEEILNERSFRRNLSGIDSVKSAGYDINTTSKWLTDFYMKINDSITSKKEGD